MKSLNRNSFNAKVYQYFYAVDKYSLPINLYVFYIKLALAYIFTLPLAIICLPATILECVDIYMGKYIHGQNRIVDKIFISFFFYGALLFVFCVILTLGLITGPYTNETLKALSGIGLLIWFMFIIHYFFKLVVFTYSKISKLIQKIKIRKSNFKANVKWEDKN